jgi:hypothetical protein
MTKLEQLHKEIDTLQPEHILQLLQQVIKIKQSEGSTTTKRSQSDGKRELEDILEAYPGGQFKTAEEVRKYVKEERDSWDN